MTSTTRTRSPSPSRENGSEAKKPRFNAASSSAVRIPLWTEVESLSKKYQENQPYKHISVPELFDDQLLESVVTESRSYGVRHDESSGSKPGWGWEEKETDIYKIRQTPDLTSLSTEHLPEETLASLPNLTKLKEGIYSREFREFIRKVTGCGPLSGKKVDGSVGLYSKGSHLLLHDDSISTRVVSYILYLPNSPLDAPTTDSLTSSSDGSFLKGWRPEWGGALELYPVGEGKGEVGPPAVKRSHKVDVKWGNLVFFEVQPGKSYHSVEEVIVGDGRQRLGVSGWFHRPIEGEEGYEPEDLASKEQKHSSLAQITAAPPTPFKPYELDVAQMPNGLTSRHLKYLSAFLAPAYLTASTLEKLSGQFVEESALVMHNFLKPEIADKIRDETQHLDQKYPSALIPPHSFGESDSWKLQGPSSKHRYLSLRNGGDAQSAPTLRSVLSELFVSEAFRAWLAQVSSLVVLAHRCEARRFRRGLDYTLAAGEDKDGEPRLDGVLGLSWWAKTNEDEEDPENGGWEAYLASPDEDEDPAVYQSQATKKAEQASQEEDAQPESSTNGATAAEPSTSASDGPKITLGGVELEFDQSQLSPSDFDTDSEAGDDDDGPLLSNTVGFNKFLLVLRDPGVMRFVKYLSNSAAGSRWDVSGEWEVGQLEVEDDE